jgi:hypothetical protein
VLRRFPTGACGQTDRVSKTDPPQRGLPPLAWAGIFGGVFLALALVVLLAVQLAVLTDSREHIRSQDAKITRLYEAAGPAVDEARPLAREARPLLARARSGLRALRRQGGTLADAAYAVPRLMRAGEALAAETLPLVRALQDAGLAQTVVDADALIHTSGELLRQISAEDLVAVAARSARLAPRILHIQRRLLKVQKATLTVQRQTRGIQAQTLQVQLRALAGIESIDRKTGGRVPPAPVPSAR